MAWVQRALAAAAGLAIAYLAWAESWPFDSHPAAVTTYEDPSVWQYLFSDQYVLGLVQLALAVVAFYFVVSVPALIAAARWAKAFGTSGVTADDAAKASRTLEDYENELAETNTKLKEATETIDTVRRQRDTALRLLRRSTSTTTATRDIGESGPIRPIMREGEEAENDPEPDQRDAGSADAGGEGDRRDR